MTDSQSLVTCFDPTNHPLEGKHTLPGGHWSISHLRSQWLTPLTSHKPNCCPTTASQSR